MAEKTNVYSNYLIDISKKGVISSTGRVSAITQFDAIESLGQAFLRGDLKTDFLKNVGFEYKESFTEYDKEIKAKFDKLTGAIKDLLGFLMKGNKFDLSANDLRGRIIDIELLFHYFTGDDNNGYDNLQAIIEQYNYIAKYKIPARKKIPTIEVSKLDSIVFEFAFGKCNLFDAKKEVWDPITYIKNSLIPTPTSSDIPGMYNIRGLGDGIPYTNFALIDLIDGVKSQANKVNEDGVPVTINSIMKRLQDSGKVVTQVAGDAKEDFLSCIREYIEGLKLTDNGGEAPENTGLMSKRYVELKDGLKEDKRDINSLLEKAGINVGGDFYTKYFEEYDITKVEEDRNFWDNFVSVFGVTPNEKGITTKLEWLKPEGSRVYSKNSSWNFGENNMESKIKNDPNIQVTLKSGGDASKIKDFNVEVINQEARRKEVSTLENILKNIATLDIRAQGQAVAQAYKKIMDKTDKRFWLGCGYIPQFAHSLTQFSYTDGKGFDNPMILYGPFVIKELKIEMDMYDLDQRGCPMSGRVTIIPWNLHTYGQGLKFGPNAQATRV